MIVTAVNDRDMHRNSHQSRSCVPSKSVPEGAFVRITWTMQPRSDDERNRSTIRRTAANGLVVCSKPGFVLQQKRCNLMHAINVNDWTANVKCAALMPANYL